MKQPLFQVYWILILVAIFCTTDVFAQPEYNMSNNTVTDCEGILYDSGGPNGEYGSNENFTFTICPDPVPVCLRLNLGTVVVETLFDTFNVYDGVDDTGGTLLFHNGGTDFIESLEASSGCITVIFNSDASDNKIGWEATWSCFDTACPEEILLPTEQDCLGAIPLCLGEYSETNAFSGEGNVRDEISVANSCLLNGELNSVWYTFTVLNSGDLGFSITPNDLGDDYDWAVFHTTNAGCEDIPTDPSLLVSCNYSSELGVTGPTGATTQTEAGGADANQNALIPVLANETYVINVSQFTTSESGYTINFDASTAVIFDDEPPSLETAALCGSNNLRLKLPENVFCSTVGIEDFTLSGPAGQHTITAITSQACLDGADYDRFFNLLFDPAISVAGQYILTLVGEVEDLCNNTSNPNNQLVFDITENDIRAPIEDLDVCAGDDLTLVVNNSDPAAVYNFYLESSLDSLLGTGQQLDVSQYITAQDTPFFFYITEVDSECDNIPTEVSVIVRDLAVADLLYDSPICFDESAPPALPTLSAESTQGGTFEITGGATIDVATGEVDISTTSQGVTYTITYTTPTSNCSVSATANVDVVGPPILSIEGLESGYSESTGDVPLTANIPGAVFAGPGITANSNIFNTQAAGLGVHDICVTYTDPITGCAANTCLPVEVFSRPTATFEVNSATCIGEEIELTYTGNIDPDSGVFTWSFGDGTQVGGTDANPIVQWDSPGIQTISLTVEFNGISSDEETMDIDLVDIEVVNSTESVTITPGESIDLIVDASSSNGNNLSYEWSPSDDLTCNDCPNPSASPSSFTNYSVVVTDSESGCSESASFQVNVTRQSRIAIPKAFTPSGGGLNDTYRILIRGFTEAEFQIYDRSGNRVFESQDPTNDGWDGIYENEPQNIGVYVYYLIVTFDNGDRRLYQGNITLIR
ncbi:MAG: gliding motility-associated C-terminal domain-containing protein [Chitinophagales bacterium]